MKDYWWTTSLTGCDEVVTPNETPDFEPWMLIGKWCHCRCLLREDQKLALMFHVSGKQAKGQERICFWLKALHSLMDCQVFECKLTSSYVG